MRILKSSAVIRDESFLQRSMSIPEDTSIAVRDAVDAILRNVRTHGDQALLEYTANFDGFTPESADALKIPEARIVAAYEQLDRPLRDALERAADRVRAYHEHIVPQPVFFTDEQGVELGNIWRPMDRAGIYVPGGKAAYPSSVIMNAIPASVAGVPDIVMVTPTPGGDINDTVLAAAHICGITHIYTIGGAHAIAALAYGTDTINNVDIIAGPGNKYVAEAKRAVYGCCGIDMIAGPSEILVLAEDSAVPFHAAADLLSQAEHDEDASCYLICYSETQARAIETEIQRLIPTLPRKDIIEASWQKNGAIILADTVEEALTAINHIAPEHLELLSDTPERYIQHIRHAGAVFSGHYTPEAIGDYNAGPSHVLPTAGSAAFSSGVSVFTFLKRLSYISNNKASFEHIADDAAILADAEGLQAHALSVRIRGDH